MEVLKEENEPPSQSMIFVNCTDNIQTVFDPQDLLSLVNMSSKLTLFTLWIHIPGVIVYNLSMHITPKRKSVTGFQLTWCNAMQKKEEV